MHKEHDTSPLRQLSFEVSHTIMMPVQPTNGGQSARAGDTDDKERHRNC